MSARWALAASAVALAGCACETPTVPAEPVRETPTVQSYGVAPVYQAVSGSGRDIPLARAIRSIVPSSYVVRLADVQASSLLSTVSWDDRQDWTKALQQAIAGNPNLAVDVAAGSRLVVIRQLAVRPQPAVAAGMPGETGRPTAPKVPGPSKKRAPAVPAIPTTVPPPSLRAASASDPRIATATTDAGVSSTSRDVDVSWPAVDAGVATMRPAVLRTVATRQAIDAPTGGNAGGDRRAASAPPAVAAPAAGWVLDVDDRTLKTALDRWCRQAGWQLLWDLRVDYALQAAATVPGTFQEAVGRVVHDMGEAEVPLRAVFYQGNKVLRIVARGME